MNVSFKKIADNFILIGLITGKLLYEHTLYALMASINISIKQDAYEFLKKFKTEDKSFSDIILSFRKENNDVMRFFGALKNSDWDNKEEKMKEFRKSFNSRIK